MEKAGYLRRFGTLTEVESAIEMAKSRSVRGRELMCRFPIGRAVQRSHRFTNGVLWRPRIFNNPWCKFHYSFPGFSESKQEGWVVQDGAFARVRMAPWVINEGKKNL